MLAERRTQRNERGTSVKPQSDDLGPCQACGFDLHGFEVPFFNLDGDFIDLSFRTHAVTLAILDKSKGEIR